VLLLIGRVCWRLGQAAWAKSREPRLKVNRAGAAKPKALAGTIVQVVKKARPAPVERDVTVPDEDTLSLPPGPPPPGPNGARVWRLPAVELFKAASVVEMSQADVKAQARTIEETLQSFNIQSRVTEVSTGPTVTQFGLEPAPGVAVNRILARQHD